MRLRRAIQNPFSAEQRIDAGIVRRVVPVVACRFKDRVQVQDRDAERGEIRQLFLDAPERSAPERPRGDVPVFRAGIEHRRIPVTHEKAVRAAACLRLARRPVARAGKAVRKDLIDDAVLPPVGDGGFFVYGDLPGARLVVSGTERVPEHARRFGQRHRDGKPSAALGCHGEERILARERVQPERHVRRARLFRGEIYLRAGLGGAERTAEGAVSGFVYDHVKRPRYSLRYSSALARHEKSFAMPCAARLPHATGLSVYRRARLLRGEKQLVGIEIQETETGALAGVAVVGLNAVGKSAGLPHDGHGAVAHGDHLGSGRTAQSARA